MTIKSVVDVDVNDAKFKRFGELFAKYQASLAKVPGQWKQVAAAEGQASTEFEKILASFFAMGELQHEMLDSSDKDNKNLQKKASLWQGIRKTTTGILDDVNSISKTLLKWGLIGFGAGTASLFGIRAIAESVSQDRRFALGTGLDIGAQQAFARNQGRLLDNPDQFLTAAFNARSNLQSPAFATLAALGISPNQSTTAVANQVLTRLQSLAKSVPQQQLGTLLAEYPGLSQFGVGLNTLQQLKSIRTEELQGNIKAFGPDLAQSRLNAGQGLAFQNFVTSIDTTFAKVERQFERDLVRLLPPIEHFITKLGDIIHKFLASPASAKAIDELGTAIERFATYLGSPQFTAAVDNFTSATGSLMNAVTFVTNPRGVTAGAAAEAATASQAGFALPQGVLRGQTRLGGDLGQVVKRDREIMDRLGFVPAQDRLRVMLADFYLSQQKGGEGNFLTRVRGNLAAGRDALAGQTKDVRDYVRGSLGGAAIAIHNNTGGNATASMAQLTGGAR